MIYYAAVTVIESELNTVQAKGEKNYADAVSHLRDSFAYYEINQVETEELVEGGEKVLADFDAWFATDGGAAVSFVGECGEYAIVEIEID